MLWFGLFSLIFLRRSYLALQLVRVAGLGALLTVALLLLTAERSK